LEKRDDVNYSEITEAYSFTLEISALLDGVNKEKEWDIIAIKMDGKWYLTVGSNYNSNIRWLMDVAF